MMTPLELADAAKGGPFVVRWAGEVYLMPDPADLPFMEVMARLYLRHLPETPVGDVDLAALHPQESVPGPAFPEWQRELLFERWAAHYDLPTISQAQRLAYLTEHYFDDLVHDFQTLLNGLDYGALWRGRRWATLLRHIDRLPPHSWYSAAVAKDPEHVKMLIEAMVAREESEEDDGEQRRPSWVGWTPEIGALVALREEVRHLTYVTQAVQGGKAKPPEPMSRPESPFERAQAAAAHRRRKAKHEALVARLLPHKARAET